jgi:thioredoxin 1
MKQHHAEVTFIFDVNEHDFAHKVLDGSHQLPILVDFWADWCAPCRVLTPILERVVHAYEGRVALAKVEVDDNMRLAGHYRLRGFPTVILFRDGEPTDRFSGARHEHAVREFIDSHLTAG